MKKNNTIERAIVNADEISAALTEGTKKTLRNIMNEAISNYITEGEEGDDEKEEVEEKPVEGGEAEDDAETEDTPEVTDVESDDDADEAEDADGEEADVESDDTDEEWSDLDDYKVGDNDYDFTGADEDTVLKVYNKLGDNDQIFIKKEDDGTYTMKDNDTDAEYVIELPEDGDMDADADDADDEVEIDLGVDDSDVDSDDTDDDTEIELDTDDDSDDTDDDTEIELDTDDDDDDELNESDDLGYTDSYQKDVFKGKFNMSEPSKGMNDWDGGAPKGSDKPWAGKGDGKPFDEQLNEGDTIATQPVRKMVKTKHGQHRPNNSEEVKKVDSPVNESISSIISKAKAIQAENKQYKEAINSIKQSLKEAAVLNVNYGKVVSLLVNETTSKKEKLNILERFENVKTIKEGAELYNAIKRELNESKTSKPILEHAINANSSKTINETTIYQNKDNKSINLMERMDNLYKKGKK